MTDSLVKDAPSLERRWSASKTLLFFSEAAAAVQPLSTNIADFVQSAGVTPTDSLKVQHGMEHVEVGSKNSIGRQQQKAVTVAPTRPAEILTTESLDSHRHDAAKSPRSPSSNLHVFAAKHSSGTLSVLSAAAASLKGKTQLVAQQQKRALSAFQQKGGLVSWLHGEMDESDELHHDERTGDPYDSLSPGLSPPFSPKSSNSVYDTAVTTRSPSFADIDNGDDLREPPSLRLSIESPDPRPMVEKSVGRRQSMPNIGSVSLFDNLFDKVISATTSSLVQPSSPSSPSQVHTRVTLRPTVVTNKSMASSLDGFMPLQQTEISKHRLKGSMSPDSGRQRAATTDDSNHFKYIADPESDDLLPPVLLQAHSTASLTAARPQAETRFSLDDVLSDKWCCTVLWAHLYSSAAHQHHQRLSFLIDTTFRITPLFQKLAAVDGTSSEKLTDYKSLIARLRRLHRRYLVHNGAAALATSGVPVASPIASHAKHKLSGAVKGLMDKWELDSELVVHTRIEQAMALLLQLVREVEREFRVLATRYYANFADSAIYRDFVDRGGGHNEIAALLRAARIPFYQKPNTAAEQVSLNSLAVTQDKVETAFYDAGCQVFALTAQTDGSIQFTDVSPRANGDDAGEDSQKEQSILQHTLEPFLNPAANIHPAASKPLAYNFIAGSGVNLVYGAVIWLPVGQGIGWGTDNTCGGLCASSKLPLVDSLRHFLHFAWKNISNNVNRENLQSTMPSLPIQGREINVAMSLPVSSEDVKNALRGIGKRVFTLLQDPALNKNPLPVIDFRLGDLFDCLSLTNVLRLFAFALLEKKVVLVASSYTILFNVSEALRTLLHPLVWSHVYVPVLPLALKGCLHCPTPFIFGLHDSYVRRSELPRPSADLVVVNLDRDSLTGGGEVFLPPVRQSVMREELFRLCKPHLTSRDNIDSFSMNTPPGTFPTQAFRELFHKNLRDILALLEPCVNRFEFKDMSVSVVDSINSTQWSADTARFYSTLLQTQAVSTYLACNSN